MKSVFRVVQGLCAIVALSLIAGALACSANTSSTAGADKPVASNSDENKAPVHQDPMMNSDTNRAVRQIEETPVEDSPPKGRRAPARDRRVVDQPNIRR